MYPKIRYILNDKPQELYFYQDRLLIGSGPFSQIRFDERIGKIAAVLFLKNGLVEFKCVEESPSIYSEGGKLKTGESWLLDNNRKIAIGPHEIEILFYEDKEDKAPQDNSLQYLLENDYTKFRLLLTQKVQDGLNGEGREIKEDDQQMKQFASLIIRKEIYELNIPSDFKFNKKTIEKQILDEIFGLGPLEELLEDQNISEIMVNCRDQIFVEKNGGLTLSEIGFTSDQALINVIERIVSEVGRRIDTSSPIVDARLLDGSRVNAVIPPIALKGPNLTIRRFSKTPITTDKLVNFGSFTERMADFFKTVVEQHKNIVISGGTGSGKTTLLNALSGFIPNNERIITVEDAAELQLQQTHVVSLETRPANLEGKGAIPIRHLIKNTLRMRPDRIIVGECRGGEALDMLQAMNTGHDGSMTTGHANTPEDMLRRLETMVMMSGMELPLSAIREQIASAICVIIQQTRRKNGKRLITEVSWIQGVCRETGRYLTSTLFKADKQNNIHEYTENINRFLEEEEIEWKLMNKVEA